MPDSTTFYRFRSSVARIVRTPDALSIAIYDRSIDKWVDFPGMYGKLTGLGGDPPLDVITRDEALRIIDGDLDAPSGGGERRT